MCVGLRMCLWVGVVMVAGPGPSSRRQPAPAPPASPGDEVGRHVWHQLLVCERQLRQAHAQAGVALGGRRSQVCLPHAGQQDAPPLVAGLWGRCGGGMKGSQVGRRAGTQPRSATS